ncbi:uncharacterized protein CcaverHIS019_0203070 [Cutaneotrichosporon cavernicola]|uniref:Protein kinase domain-containing protein n=1 Tax=Cutaneotrichosporon cavernicola TaxID=279322 RepID=A0AA48I6U4_9TREE|nr:uncharacterized protein CcaverHIS019_0203070 [Cutaneotrichosporon cavernicola]BEI88945.1 hypothetical protein CcaverHIS019_0203070 [Cutaneotrichosporon cavernicola]BEI96722.1 hypothetical protein CcaverHIS631_0203110 [Cutaneotrichosporon cavernicola]BEJ04494.1 hypothetical protein CcaverHIS641_0203110 [Cutaneotrichosporon cavernicola]
MSNQFSIPTRQQSNSSLHSHHSLPYSHQRHNLHHQHHASHSKSHSSHMHGPVPTKSIQIDTSASIDTARESAIVDRSRAGDRFLDHDRRMSASVPPSVPSSASASKNSSFIGTPTRLLSRRSSTREGHPIMGQAELKGRGREEGVHSEGGSPEEEVIETAELRLDRDPGTGRKMVNQYLVLHEIGHGTHGRVRLGRDMSVDVPPDELEVDLATGSGPFYAIKIVQRNSKIKRLAGLRQQKRNGSPGTAKLVAENEIRKEIAIAKKLHHPNVVRMKEIIDDPESSKLYMIFEYCDGGEVEWKAAGGGPALTLAQTRRIFRDTLLGLEYLHHQGIIHRDIKPSNLLKSGDKYKISDFGCSHFSEALLSASATGGEEQYVDDIELAKTAGSPAFFAPEMCYSDIPEEDAKAVPTFKVRPPSATDNDLRRPGSFTVLSRDREHSPQPQTQRTFSSASAASTRKPRLPITNAIDVWALGVTLYCLLFSKTPFDAANEYLLMQEIPTAKYVIPATLSREGLPTDGSNAEASEVLDLLSRLLEKDATKRISVDGAKHHAFTLRGLPDPQAWLASTDPHAESFVTVTNEEVAAAVTRGGSIREKFRRGFNSISRRLGFGRHRSHSITDTSDANGEHSGGSASGTDTGTRRVASDNGAVPTQSNLARRLSMLSRDRSRAESPRPGLLAAHLQRERNTSPSTPVHHEESHLRLPANSEVATPRLLPSATSLDKFRSDSFRTDSPTRPLPRRQSSDVTGDLRPRTGSNASSSAGSVLALGRSIFRGESMSKRGSQRSVNALRDRGYTQSSEETDNNVFVGSFASSNGAFPRAPSSEFLRGRSFDELGRRQSTDTLEPSSPSSHSHSAFGHMSPERVAWPSSFRGGSDRGGMPGRRGSTLSEDIRPVMEDEEVDWDGGIPDSDDECSSDGTDGLPMGHGITSAPVDWNLSECIDALERRERLRHLPPVRSPARTLLRPSAGIDFSTLRTGSPHSSPHRAPPSSYSHLSSSVRARSPLTPHDPLGGIATAPHHAHTTGANTPIALPSTPEAFADAPDDDDGIVIASRGRRGSALSRGNSLARRPGVATPTPMHPTASAVAQRLAS